ncbi:MAG TPA: type II toxin-antitoxin system prevent-host-death family antitoxin [Solirubrobacterales bacterium]|nr:type II toxin-antitoxin system prevent-host-death family antitoxin [Solirubrobacterales bacterium]
MNRIGIRELRADLSNHVKRAAAGQPVVVTIDGEPRAVLSPFVIEQQDLTLDELIRTGRVIPGPKANEPRPPRPKPIAGGRPTSEVLAELREEKI